MYQVRPARAVCSPDVLARYCILFEREGDAHRRNLIFDGLALSAAILPPGTIAFEGDVQEERMGDW